jgi:hypothetical protein
MYITSKYDEHIIYITCLYTRTKYKSATSMCFHVTSVYTWYILCIFQTYICICLVYTMYIPWYIPWYMLCIYPTYVCMCHTTQCTTCWCPRNQLQDTDQVFPLGDTQEIRAELETERAQLLKQDGTARDMQELGML